jgi:hypothetical protein
MLNILRKEGVYLYSPNIKWNLTRFFLSLEMNLNSKIESEELLRNINDIGLCNEWSFINDNMVFKCKWDLRRVKNIRVLEEESSYLLKFT